MSEEKIVATNRQARFNYHLMDHFEAGMELKGTEVKSLRAGQIILNDSFVRIDDREAILYNAHIAPYEYGNIANVDPVRPRKLLLHKNQIKRLAGELATKNVTLIPIRVYFKNGMAKVEIALAKGKKTHDKRDSIRKRESDMEMRRAMKAGR